MKKLLIFRALFLTSILLLLVSCKSMDGLAGPYDNDLREYDLYDKYVDEYGNEGIVAFKEDEDDFRFVIVLSLDEAKCIWGPENDLVYNLPFELNVDHLDSFRFGLTMNRMVELRGFEKYPAFAWCNEKNKDGKSVHSSSWMLPSFRELDCCFQDIDELNARILEYGGMPVRTAGDFYWSATEDVEGYFEFSESASEEIRNQGYDQYNFAIPLSGDNYLPSQKIYWTKSLYYYVRAIKYIRFESEYDDGKD